MIILMSMLWRDAEFGNGRKNRMHGYAACFEKEGTIAQAGMPTYLSWILPESCPVLTDLAHDMSSGSK